MKLQQYRRLRGRRRPPAAGSARSATITVHAPGARRAPPEPPTLAETLPARALAVLESPPASVITVLDGAVLGETRPADVMKHFFRGRSPETLAAYKRDLADYATWRGLDVHHAVGDLLAGSAARANTLALDYHADLLSRGFAASTRARRLAVLRSLTKMARMVGAVTWAIEVEGPKVEAYKDTRGPGLDVIRKMLAACGNGLEGYRNRAMLLVLATLGLRRAEVARLRLQHFDVSTSGARLWVQGKGGKDLWVTMPATTAKAVGAWINVAGITEPNAPLFYSLRNDPSEPLTARGVHWIVASIGRRVGAHVWPHGLRHSAITAGLDAGHSYREVKEMSRHTNIQTIVRYDDNRQDLGARVAESIAGQIGDAPEE